MKVRLKDIKQEMSKIELLANNIEEDQEVLNTKMSSVKSMIARYVEQNGKN